MDQLTITEQLIQFIPKMKWCKDSILKLKKATFASGFFCGLNEKFISLILKNIDVQNIEMVLTCV